MKELQNFLYKHMDALKHHKRYVAMLTALSLLVSFMVPLILIEPADSMTKQKLMLLADNATASDGVTIVDDEAEKVKLLVGSNKPEITGSTVEETLSLARSKYLLGIASQFGVFLEGNFIDHSADVESRLAVGGGANLSDSKTLEDIKIGDKDWEKGQKGFEVGNGDFTDKISLEKLTNNWDFAHAIVGTGPFRMINTVSHDEYKKIDDSSGKLGKLFVIGSDVNLNDTSVNYTWNKQAYDVSSFRKTDEPLIDFTTEFAHIRNISKKLSEQVTEGTALIFSANVNNISYDAYKDNIVAFDSLNSDKYWNGNIAHFRYTGEDTNVVKFNITYEEWLAVSDKCSIISYEGIPENANIIINVAKESENILIEVTPQYKFTLVNGVQITPGNLTLSGKEDLNYTVKNNDEYCEKILYNFSTATSLNITENFSGNILAPNADVTGAKNGHLSGALVAKSFSGALEFGYRPYQGTIDLLGSTAGYVVPFDKFVDDLNGNGNDNPRLAGATFEIKDENNNVVDTWTSTEETSYITFPTELDFTGGKTYNETNQTVTHTYTISEKSAPEGYTTTAETYSVEVKETVDLGYLLPVDNGTIPTRATVEIKIFKNSDTAPVYSCKMIVEDTYSDNGIIQRIIAIDGSTKEYYVLNIESGNVTSVGSPTDPSVLDYIWTETANVEFDVQAMNVDGVDVLEDETDTSAENTEESTEEETTEEETTEEKKDPEIPNYLTATYGQKLSEIIISNDVDYGTWSWVNDDDDITVGDVGEKTFLANFKSNSNDYKSVENVAITVNVIKAQPAVNPVLNPSSDYTQGDTLPTITISDDDTAGTISWVNSTAKLKYGENVLEWEFTPDERNNYEEATGEITITASAIPTNLITLEKGEKTAQKLSDGKHYYDPTSLMIMPLPDETPSFINEYALVFKKQSDESTALAGATIELQSGTISNGEFNKSTSHGADSTPPWEWGNETNTYSIPLKKIQVKDLDTNVVYRFFEQTPPKGYEIAKPIYFVKTDNTTIRYTDDETKLSDINSWTEIEFSESNKSSNIITMTDYKIYGPEIKLSKVQNGSTNPLQGAEFELYAVDGDTLVYPLNDGTKLTSGSDGMIDFTKVFKANPDSCNSEYIKNGYLIPGEYYLKETKAPDKYEVPTDNMYFVVNEDYTIEAEKVEKPDAILVTLESLPDESGQYDRIWTVKLDNKQLNGSSGAEISGVKTIEVKLTNSNQVKIYTNTSSSEIPTNFESSITKAEFNPTINLTKIEVQPKSGWDPIEIEYITITTADGTVYTSDLSTVGDTTPTAYTLSSEPVFSSGDAYYTIENVGSNTSGSFDKLIELGAENAGKKITRVVYFVSNASGAGVQLKNLNDSDTDISNIQDNNITNEGLDREYTDRYLNNSGKCRITAWNCTIDKVYIYLEGMESTGSCDLTVLSVKAYYLDGTSDTATSINALSKKDNIIGLEVTLGGSGSGNIQVNDAWKATGVTAGETITFGETDYTPPAAETGNSPLISVKDNTTTLVVGNNKAGATTNISVEKIWNDSENLYNIRPDSITVQLKQDNSNFGEPVTLNAANGWKHTWTGIPRLKDNSETETYKYTVEEINAPTGYDVTYSNNSGIESGTITITNTLKTTNIPVEKKWVDSKGNLISEHPNSVTVKLQKHNGSGYSDFLDKNGNAVTLTLSSANSWAGEFTGIPEGTYQVVESVVPSGWTESSVTENGKTIITNTQKAGALKLTKIWQNDTADQRPENITIKIYRTITPPAGTTMVPSAKKSENVTEDYARLLQYSLYFYDANMCGDEVTENSVYSWRNTNCHTYDGEYAGGFHDAGDHAMFGLPQGFTASTLGWTYNEYKTTFDSLGLKNHYQLIMKEFCDFFVKSTKMSNGSVSDLLLDKGDAGTDHSYWGSPEAQSQGQRGGLVWANSDNSGGNIAAEYAAALASYYLNFPNDSNSSTYLEYAKALYNYSSVKINPRSISGIYYDDNITDEQAWAAAWLYLATNEESYKNDCKNKLNSLTIPTRGHFWGDPTLGAAIIYATRIEPDETTIENKISTYLNSTCSGDSFKVLDKWGSARHNTLLQLTAITYDKYQNTKSYSDWCKKQMAFILGDNSINVKGKTGVCFVTGFKDGDSDTSNDAYLPQHPHHRAASGYDSWDKFNDAKAKGTDTQYEYAHTLIGALVGGTENGYSYNDNIDDTVCNEVAIDYNAGLVGAAAALYSVYKSGHTVTKEVMVADGLELKTGKTIYEEQPQAASINIEDIINTSAMSFKRNAVSVLADNGSGEISIQRYNHSFCSIPDLFKSKCLNLVQVYFNGSTPQDFKFLLKDWEWGTELAQKGDYSISGSVISWEFNGITGIGSFFTEQTQSETLQTYIQKIVLSYSDGSKFEITNSSFVSTTPTITITNPTTDSQTLVVGDTFQLAATSSDDSAITWSSLNSNAVQVDPSSGLITAVGIGDATITATAGTATDTVNIHVDALQISVNNKTDSATFAKDDTPTFSVNGQTEGHSFKWTSSHSEVLEIDETTGQAVALKSGQDIEITVVKDGNSSYKDTITVNVTSNFSIEVSPTVIRPGKSAQLSALNADGNVNYTEKSDYLTIEEIDGIKYAKASDSVTTETQITITGNDVSAESTCELTINPIGNPVIIAPNGNTEEYILGIDQTLQLTASNILGTATWTSSNESVVALEENASGSNTIAIRSITNGESTITVTDTDGTYGEYEITVKEQAADPGLPEGKILYTTITLTSADLANGNWEKIVNLPIEDENGQKYYYYIEEVTVNDVVNGNGGKYMPIKYEGQGVTLNEVGSETPEISVTNRLTQTIQGQLPSTGGSGVKTYYYFGGALMLLGIAGFTGLKRRERKRREE